MNHADLEDLHIDPWSTLIQVFYSKLSNLLMWLNSIRIWLWMSFSQSLHSYSQYFGLAQIESRYVVMLK